MKKDHPILRLCLHLEVSASGYYDWQRLRSCPGQRAMEDQALAQEIGRIHTRSRETYGAPRVEKELRQKGRCHGRNRVARLMKEQGLCGRQKGRYRVQTTDSNHDHPIASNLLAQAPKATAPNRLWVADIKYVSTWQGWLYLAVVMDLFSRKIVGWSAGPTIHRELVLDAVLMAVRQRRPRGTVIHSDQGTQYGSDAWRRFCRTNRLEPSMSRRGNCWDNAVAESFFSSLKKERIKKQIYKNRKLALNDIADYIDRFYNPTRRHSHLGGVSPEAFERASA